MAEIELRLEVLGEEILVRRLSRFGEGIKDFRPAFRRIIDNLREAEEDLFSSEGHGKWPPLSPAYALWKAENYPGQPIMRATNLLYNSLTKGPGGIEELNPMSMRWGTNVPYARYHQTGTSRMPQRRIVDLLGKEKTGIMKELQKFVVSKRDDVE